MPVTRIRVRCYTAETSLATVTVTMRASLPVTVTATVAVTASQSESLVTRAEVIQEEWLWHEGWAVTVRHRDFHCMGANPVTRSLPVRLEQSS